MAGSTPTTKSFRSEIRKGFATQIFWTQRFHCQSFPLAVPEIYQRQRYAPFLLHFLRFLSKLCSGKTQPGNENGQCNVHARLAMFTCELQRSSEIIRQQHPFTESFGFKWTSSVFTRASNLNLTSEEKNGEVLLESKSQRSWKSHAKGLRSESMIGSPAIGIKQSTKKSTLALPFAALKLKTVKNPDPSRWFQSHPKRIGM